MANTRNSAPADDAVVAVTTAVADALDAYVAPSARVAVALSGGIDSMVLLDALADVAAGRSLELSAVHVHHGLSPNADQWALFCAEHCASRNVELAVHSLHLERKRGESLEALARDRRYEHFASCEVDVIALAHHADDQAETVLLQLLRGAGPRGLSAMPAFQRGTPALLRPLLPLTRTTLAAYAKKRSLRWIEDESNTDTRHRRNFLRHEIAPRLAAGFAGYPATLARAASHQAAASDLLDELAALDATGAVDEVGLGRAQLAGLSDARAANLLRWFLRCEGLRAPSQARLAEMLRQLVLTAADARVSIEHEGSVVGIHRGRVVVHARQPAPFVLAWHGERELRLPSGTLAFVAVQGAGLCAAKLEDTRVSLRSRTGGERMQLATNRPHHAVKKLLQRAGLPLWERDALPLLWCGDELAAIPGIGVAVPFQAACSAAGWELHWKPDAAAGSHRAPP
jgi:tRNA(Ile)-lysidine synthase